MDETFNLSEVSEIVRNDPDGHRLTEYLKTRTVKVVTRRIYDYEGPRVSIDAPLRKASEGGEGENSNENNQDKPIENIPPMEVDENVDPSTDPLDPFRHSGHSPLTKRTPHAPEPLRQTTLKRLTRKKSGLCLSNVFNTSQSVSGVEFLPHISSTPMNKTPEIPNALNKATLTKPTSTENGKSTGQILMTPLNDAGDNENNDSNRISFSNGTARFKEPENSKKQGTSKGIQQEEIGMESNIEQIQRTPPRMGNKSGLTEPDRIMQNSPQRPNNEITCPENQVILSKRPSATTLENAENNQNEEPNERVPNDNIMTDDEEFRPRKTRKMHVIESSDESDTNETHNTPTIVTCFKRSRPLNKAPRTPINGEQFADELKKQVAGLSNRRVLDLRRRKSSSLGKNKPLSLSKKREDAAKEPNQPNATSTKSMAEQNDDRQCTEKSKDIESPSLAPVDAGQLEMEVFEDELSDDRISFLPRVETKTATNHTKAKRKGVKKPVTSEVCKSYIESKKKLAGSKKRINESKRSLYSLGIGKNSPVSPSTSVFDIVPPPLMFRSSLPRRKMRSSTTRINPSQTQTPLAAVNSRSPSPLPSSSLSLQPRSSPSPPPSSPSLPPSAPSSPSPAPSSPSSSPSSPPSSPSPPPSAPSPPPSAPSSPSSSPSSPPSSPPPPPSAPSSPSPAPSSPSSSPSSPPSSPSPPPSAPSPPPSAPSQSPAESISSIPKNKNEKRKKKEKEKEQEKEKKKEKEKEKEKKKKKEKEKEKKKDKEKEKKEKEKMKEKEKEKKKEKEKEKKKEKFENEKSKKNDDEVFKKPTGKPPKKKPRLQPVEAETSQVNVRSRRNVSSLYRSPPVDVQPSADEPTLRRSTRVRKPMPKPLFWVMWEKSLIKSIDDAEKRRLKKEAQLSSAGSSNITENDMMPIASSTANTNSVINNENNSAQGRNKNKRRRNALEGIPENEPLLTVQQPTTETMDNDINDHTTENANVITQAQQPSGTNLSEWLKQHNCDLETTSLSSVNTFMNMNVDMRNELCFSSFDSMEYAFYNATNKSSGYMRFQPRQTKPTARVTQVLKLLIMTGEFDITTDGETACVKTGDLITINIGSRYSIESIIDEIAVILFMKV